MNTPNEEYNKIIQLLTNRDPKNVLLGLQLLKSTLDTDLLIQFLSDRSYIGGMVCYPLVPLFQQNSKIWETVKPKIPAYRKRAIENWMPYIILELDFPTLDSFCELANQKVAEYFPDFPKLSPEILTEYKGYSVASVRSGKRIIDNVGWSLVINERDIGPAEAIHEEDWIAIAQHPDFSIKIQLEERHGPIKVWLEKISNSKTKNNA